MTHSDKPLDFRDGYLPAAPGLPIVPAVKAASLLAVLIAYALGFAILYPIALTSMSNGASHGPALMHAVDR